MKMQILACFLLSFCSWTNLYAQISPGDVTFLLPLPSNEAEYEKTIKLTNWCTSENCPLTPKNLEAILNDNFSGYVSFKTQIESVYHKTFNKWPPSNVRVNALLNEHYSYYTKLDKYILVGVAVSKETFSIPRSIRLVWQPLVKSTEFSNPNLEAGPAQKSAYRSIYRQEEFYSGFLEHQKEMVKKSIFFQNPYTTVDGAIHTIAFIENNSLVRVKQALARLSEFSSQGQSVGIHPAMQLPEFKGKFFVETLKEEFNKAPKFKLLTYSAATVLMGVSWSFTAYNSSNSNLRRVKVNNKSSFPSFVPGDLDDLNFAIGCLDQQYFQLSISTPVPIPYLLHESDTSKSYGSSFSDESLLSIPKDVLDPLAAESRQFRMPAMYLARYRSEELWQRTKGLIDPEQTKMSDLLCSSCHMATSMALGSLEYDTEALKCMTENNSSTCKTKLGIELPEILKSRINDSFWRNDNSNFDPFLNISLINIRQLGYFLDRTAIGAYTVKHAEISAKGFNEMD